MKNLTYKDGDDVVVLARVKHVYKDGHVDLELADGKILFGIQPEEVGLVLERE